MALLPQKGSLITVGVPGASGYHRSVTASVVDVLEDQHRRVAGLFERVASPDEDRPAVLHTLLRELTAHVAAERATVRPVVDDHKLGEDLAGRLADEHDRMEKLMVLIERRKFNSPDVPELVRELKGVVEEHQARAETELIPELRQALPLEEQIELGQRLERGDTIVTSHPHPHLLSLGPLADIATRVAQKWDAMRDRTAINRQHPEDEGKTPGSPMADAWDHLRPSEGSGTGESQPETRPEDHRMGGA